MENGANPNVKNNSGYNVFNSVIRHGSVELCRLLLNEENKFDNTFNSFGGMNLVFHCIRSHQDGFSVLKYIFENREKLKLQLKPSNYHISASLFCELVLKNNGEVFDFVVNVIYANEKDLLEKLVNTIENQGRKEECVFSKVIYSLSFYENYVDRFMAIGMDPNIMCNKELCLMSGVVDVNFLKLISNETQTKYKYSFDWVCFYPFVFYFLCSFCSFL